MITLSLLALSALVLQAQDVIELARSIGAFVPRPDVKTDKKSKKSTAEWPPTNNAWIKDFCEAKNVAVEKDYLNIFPEVANMPLDEQPYVPMSWRLTDEGGETVMHCYFRMPADEVTNLWLTSEETCLVDSETGVQYRIRRTEPDTFRKEMDGAKKALLDDGYYLNEEDALAGLTFTVGRQLSHIAHDLEYDADGGPCKNCTRNMLMDIEAVLKLARDYYYRHHGLQKSMPNACCVPIFPNPEDMDDFEVRGDGNLYLKNPPENYKEHTKVSVGVIKPEDLPKALRDSITQFIQNRATKKDK